MSLLRITFDVEEKDVGGCLVALEGKATGVRFEVVESLPHRKPTTRQVKEQKQAMRPPKPAPGAVQKFIAGKLRGAGETGMDKGNMLNVIKSAGFNGRGWAGSINGLLKKGLVKKRGKVFVWKGDAGENADG